MIKEEDEDGEGYNDDLEHAAGGSSGYSCPNPSPVPRPSNGSWNGSRTNCESQHSTSGSHHRSHSQVSDIFFPKIVWSSNFMQTGQTKRCTHFLCTDLVQNPTICIKIRVATFGMLNTLPLNLLSVIYPRVMCKRRNLLIKWSLLFHSQSYTHDRY